MWSFMEHVPPERHAELRQAIESVTETKMLLDRVAEVLGSRDPEALAARLGQTSGGVTVTEAVVEQVRDLCADHERRRAACRDLMAAIARGDPADIPPAPAPSHE